MSWTPERIGELEKLWAEGLSTAEIGRRLGVSKNAVVGKAHRLRLPGRQSPIDPNRRRANGARRPSRPRAAPAKKAATPIAAAVPKPQPAPRVEAPPPPRPKKRAKPHNGPSCQWPYGDPRLPGFHFCGEPAEQGKPYCSEHCALAYNRVSVAHADARADAEAA